MNPGSKEAIEKGCTCAVLDNRHGKGILIKGKVQFWMNAYCPLHGIKRKKDMIDKKQKIR